VHLPLLLLDRAHVAPHEGKALHIASSGDHRSTQAYIRLTEVFGIDNVCVCT